MSFRDLMITRDLRKRIEELGAANLEELEELRAALNADLDDLMEEQRIIKSRLDLVESKIEEIKSEGDD